MRGMIILSSGLLITYIFIGFVLLLIYTNFRIKRIKAIWQSFSLSLKGLLGIMIIFPVLFLVTFQGSPANMPSLDDTENGTYRAIKTTDEGIIVAGSRLSTAYIAKHTFDGEKVWEHIVPDSHTLFDTITINDDIITVSGTSRKRSGRLLPYVHYHAHASFTMDGELLEYKYEETDSKTEHTHVGSTFEFDFTWGEHDELFRKHYEVELSVDAFNTTTQKTFNLATNPTHYDEEILNPHSAAHIFYQDEEIFAFQIRVADRNDYIVDSHVYIMDYDLNILFEEDISRYRDINMKEYVDMVKHDNTYYLNVYMPRQNSSELLILRNNFESRSYNFGVNRHIDERITHITYTDTTLLIGISETKPSGQQGKIFEFNLNEINEPTDNPSPTTYTMRDGVNAEAFIVSDDGFYTAGEFSTRLGEPLYGGRHFRRGVFTHLNDRNHNRILSFIE